jgi:hypothetical protein
LQFEEDEPVAGRAEQVPEEKCAEYVQSVNHCLHRNKLKLGILVI